MRKVRENALLIAKQEALKLEVKFRTKRVNENKFLQSLERKNIEENKRREALNTRRNQARAAVSLTQR